MRFRFTLTHDESDQTLEINEPDGWKDCAFKLERHQEFHSLVEYFDGSFIFYGNNGVVNGGISFIKSIIQNFGVDTTLLLDIDLTFDEITFSNVFNGQLSLVDSEEMPNNKIKIPVIRDDRWAKLIARMETPVDLQSPLDLDDNLSLNGEKIHLNLPSQVIQMRTVGKMRGPYPYGVLGDLSTGTLDQDEFAWLQIDWDEYTLDEISTKYTYPIASNSEIPFEKFSMDFAGEYHFRIKFYMTHAAVIYFGGAIFWDGYYDFTRSGPDFEVVLLVNGAEVGVFTQTDHGTDGSDVDPAYSSFEYVGTHDIPLHGLITIAGRIITTFPFVPVLLGYDNTGSGEFIEAMMPFGFIGAPPPDFPNGLTDDQYFEVTALTVHPETEAEGFLIHDALGYIIDRITGEQGIFYSDLLGSTQTRYRQYVSNGCGWKYAILKGLQLRQYTLTEKPFFQSLMDWWKGANPILNLSLGYDTVLVPRAIDASPDINLIEALADWSNAPGSSWDFITFGHPFVSVNGNGGIEGYAVGAAVFNAGQIYPFDVELFIQTTGTNNPEAVVTYAILDSSFNELVTREFSYVGPGSKPESFLMEAPATGAYFAVKITNNTPFDTKNFELLLAYSEAATIVYDAEDVIRVEQKAFQYDDTDGPSVELSHVRNITLKYDNDKIFNKVNIGFTRWESEDISGIDDPQTKKTYASRFKKIGKGLDLYSEWIAASLLIEKTRRTTKEKSADYKYDNETFIIAINDLELAQSPDTSPDILRFGPELDENFSNITNLLESDSRYNIRLTPGRNFLRWQNVLDGALQAYLGSFWKFTGGQGNYDMTSEMDSDSCLNDGYSTTELDEKGDIPVDVNILHLPELYEIEHPLSWDEYVQIRNQRTRPIGISETDVGHVMMFIKTLEYKPMKGTVTMVLWAKEHLDLSVQPDSTPMPECYNVTASGELCENGITDENGFVLTDEFDECITSEEGEFDGLALDALLDGIL